MEPALKAQKHFSQLNELVVTVSSHLILCIQ